MEKSVLSFCAFFSAFPMSFSCTAVFLINPKEENVLLILNEEQCEQDVCNTKCQQIIPI